LKLGNYRLERLLGRGRMGAVYLARDEALLRPTAVKLLAWRAAEAQGQDPVQWFLAEARLVARINHPRVIQIYGAARQGDHCYIAMEYVAGRSAEAVVAQDGPMSPEVATDVLVQAASALAAAHRSGVVHRDVKPANLLLGEGGVIKLGDFGMALGLADGRPPSAHLRVGTPYYTAPEIWRGEAASAASDLYSLGATYFQLLTGRPPFPGGDVAAVERDHLHAKVPDPRELRPGLPAACAALVRSVLAKSPRERLGPAQELAWEGRRVLQHLAARSSAAGRRLPAPDARAAEGADVPAWARALGLLRHPFTGFDLACPPYAGEPFASAAAQLCAWAEGGPPVVAIEGAPGTGKTALCRRVAAEMAPYRLVVAADLLADPSSAGLLERFCRLVGGAGEPDPEACLEAVVERLAEERRRRGARPLVLLDGLARLQLPVQAAALVRAAAATGAFQVVLAGSPGLAGAMAGLCAGPEEVAGLELRALSREQVGELLQACLAGALGPCAAPLFLSPDAMLLLAQRSGGTLGRLVRLAENMLVLAAARGQRTLTSFHAWTAPEGERWAGREAGALPRRPSGWPEPGARAAIDACRRAAGLPPWPSGQLERGDRGTAKAGT
jgi:serine/threonine-protein kinase